MILWWPLAATVATLGASSLTNMFQTVIASRDGSLVPVPATLEELSMVYTRGDLVRLFYTRTREIPSLDYVQGEWNGRLLDNNGLIMTAVSKILTHQLFGLGHCWSGKSFDDQGRGCNRFLAEANGNTGREVQEWHAFDCSLSATKSNASSSSLSGTLVLDYRPHQPVMSPWYTMRDELRILQLGDKQEVLLGMGSMAWSGGVWNASPFVLWRDARHTATALYST